MRTEDVARSVSELLMAVEPAGLAAVADDLNRYLDDPLPARRAMATAVLVRSGRPLAALAERDPGALLAAVASMSPQQLPDGVVTDLRQLVEDGTVDTAEGVLEVVRLSGDPDALFAWLASMIAPARDLGFDQWGESHNRAMAALRGMHAVDQGDWPDGYDGYYIPRADEAVYTLGEELYRHQDEGCIRCHGQYGEGVEGFPALALSPWVLGDPQRAATIVTHGLNGPLTMPDGQFFDGSMDPVQKGSNLSDAQVAAILTYVRQSWGNYASPVTPGDIKTAARPGDGGAWHTTKLLQRYPLEYDRLLPGSDAPPRPGVAHWKPPRGGLLVMLTVVLSLNVLLGGATFWLNRG